MHSIWTREFRVSFRENDDTPAGKQRNPRQLKRSRGAAVGTHPKRRRPTKRPVGKQAGRQADGDGNGKRSEPPDWSCPRWRANAAEECSRNKQPASAGRVAMPRLTTTAAEQQQQQQQQQPVDSTATPATRRLYGSGSQPAREIASPFAQMTTFQSERTNRKREKTKNKRGPLTAKVDN